MGGLIPEACTAWAEPCGLLGTSTWAKPVTVELVMATAALGHAVVTSHRERQSTKMNKRRSPCEG